MNDQPTAKYMQRIFLAWLNNVGKARSQKEFADYLGLEKIRFNRYYNGARTEIDYPTAIHICQKAESFGAENPFELLTILGYPKPTKFDLSSLPPEDASSLEGALIELTSRIHELGEVSETEYKTLRDTTFEKYGWKRENDTDTSEP